MAYITNENGDIRLFFTYDASGLRLSITDYTGSANSEITYWYEYDAHGNVIALLDDSGQKAVSYNYDVWGNIITSNGSFNTIDGSMVLKDANPFRYSSYYYDSETNFYYLPARYYSPYLQRFLTRDTFINQNGYLYTDNNPSTRIDPDGDSWWTDLKNWFKSKFGRQEEDDEVDAISGAAPLIPVKTPSSTLGNRITRNTVQNTLESIVVGTIQKIPTRVSKIIKIPQLGPAATITSTTFRSGTRSLKAITKKVGPVAVVALGYDLYQDYYKYEEDQRLGAMAISVGSTAVVLLEE